MLLCNYVRIRLLTSSGGAHDAELSAKLVMVQGEMLLWIYAYLVVALALHVCSIVCLVHSYRAAREATERNQVKWILGGSLTALVPMGYSLYLALLQRDRFGSGAATWPMFCASLIVTLSFTISITRYRLMQLDQILSSGVMYFAISALAAGVYYALVILALLLLGNIISEPSLTQALGVAGTVLVLLVVLDAARGRLKKALDRHFRREKLHLDRTLRRMSEAIGQLVDPPTLARRLLQTTTELLGVERGAVYLREGDPPLYRLSKCIGPPPELTELSHGCPLVEELLAHERLCVLDRGIPANGHDATGALRQMHFLGGEAAFALTHEGRMLALLVLGSKAGGVYTGEDINLLVAFAQVTVLALVSGEGGRTIEVLNRELKAKIEKIAEQQRRILALQSQLVRRDEGGKKPDDALPASDAEEPPGAASAALAQPREIVGSSPAIQNLMQLVRKVAGSPSAVLLRGESGTGKELLARAIHESSAREEAPFVKVHCAALSPTLLESELFGHVKGAFTGAVRDRPGRFELADGGTLFLDEIGDVSWEVQTKLLRVLQEMTFERVGSGEPVKVDVRVIAATHQNLERLIQEGRFREDLFYRLNVLPLKVPPLRERREDIPELVQHFLDQYARRSKKPALTVDDDALALLKAAPWPGNIRQLENVIERAVVITEGAELTSEDLPSDLHQPDVFAPEEPSEGPLLSAQAERTDRDRRDREQLVRALAAARGNKTEAARVLGLARSTLLSRLKKHGLS
jgi:transcriptional regulator with GAF, ATPase, and Fis domain